MPAALPYRLGDSSPPINPTSSAAPGLPAAGTTTTSNQHHSPTTPPSLNSSSNSAQTPISNPLHPHPYHHPHHHPHPYLHAHHAAHLAMDNHSPPGLAQHLPIRPQPQHLPQGAAGGAQAAGSALPPLHHLHHPGLMGAAHPGHLPPTSHHLARNVSPTYSTSSPVLSPLRIRVNSPSRINSELLDKSVSSTTPTSTTARDEEPQQNGSPPAQHHHYHRSSSPITTNVVGVKITASSDRQTTLHRPFSPSPKLKNVSWYG